MTKYFSLSLFMKPFFALFRRELRQFWNSPIAYIFAVAFVVLSFWLFFRLFFLVGQTEMRGFFDILPQIFLLFLPALTMRLFSEEYRQGTIETLLTSSIPISQAVLAKFCASLLFLVVTLAATFALPITLSFFGNLDWGQVISSYFGAFLLGSSYISLGLLLSILTSNQIVAFLITALSAFLLLIIGSDIVIFSLPSFLVPTFQFLSLSTHYSSMTRGVIDTRDLLYFLSFIALFLYSSMLMLKKKQ